MKYKINNKKCLKNILDLQKHNVNARITNTTIKHISCSLIILTCGILLFESSSIKTVVLPEPDCKEALKDLRSLIV